MHDASFNLKMQVSSEMSHELSDLGDASWRRRSLAAVEVKDQIRAVDAGDEPYAKLRASHITFRYGKAVALKDVSAPLCPRR